MKKIIYYKVKYKDWCGKMYQKDFEDYTDTIEWLVNTKGVNYPTLYKVILILDHEVKTYLEEENLTSIPDNKWYELKERTGLSQCEIIKHIQMMN